MIVEDEPAQTTSPPSTTDGAGGPSSPDRDGEGTLASGTVSDGAGPPTEAAPNGQVGGSGPGFGVVPALVAVLAAVFLAARRY